ncbi:MAG: glycosyl transferase [Candidatus Kerfeldbacteria bacterium CG15_BIG_FIL_POST_REV_8_21_14_020_45_12]|uniref:dolichyl-phosphate beta-glucosyltransferase n=1 Tax=Candidatus Kerfeldbacteria bacterium CG15_BIG_FIL_POST_REV_8_21_14_020_45_12 TaxID=2014247 RepID=A0A2M7H3K5_9BACT|nr:MAG: glycosyl transferase [Candidatus Kerfeldbacteria bacterium CG15_BIG_FIL_POST_REV_8_21_14_020_45_12]PJA93078.1 MAG: glycosyl transferase [Candidatus Kerfeldbacteria bacterium CG_4_9_14_3_um_filter_45_8]
MTKLDLIIPAYNEEKRIGPTLRTYLEYFDESVRLTVVLNGCTDNTAAIVESYQSWAGDRLRLIESTGTAGKGRAIVEGWKASDSELLGFVDADASTNPGEFEKLMLAVDGVDGVIASRFMPGATIVNRQGSLRTLMSRAFSTAVKIIFGMPFQDTQCGAKIFHRSALAPILDKLQETSMVFDVELLWRLYKNGSTIREIPSYWVDKAGSPLLGHTGSFLRTGSLMLLGLFRIRFNRQ